MAHPLWRCWGASGPHGVGELPPLRGHPKLWAFPRRLLKEHQAPEGMLCIALSEQAAHWVAKHSLGVRRPSPQKCLRSFLRMTGSKMNHTNNLILGEKETTFEIIVGQHTSMG